MTTVRSRDRWVRVLVGLPDQPSRDLAATMAAAGSTVSPMNRGLHWDNMGIDGSGVLENPTLLPYPLQAFIGVTRTIYNPQSAFGDLGSSSAPDSKGVSALPSTAWLDLAQMPGTRWG